MKGKLEDEQIKQIEKKDEKSKQKNIEVFK
jgi:hypothetical protein